MRQAGFAARRIILDPELKRTAGTHRRILLHEYFHFAWVRLGNPRRLAWEAYLEAEWNLTCSRRGGLVGGMAEAAVVCVGRRATLAALARILLRELLRHGGMGESGR